MAATDVGKPWSAGPAGSTSVLPHRVRLAAFERGLSPRNPIGGGRNGGPLRLVRRLTTHGHSVRGRAGFSLVELLVVLGVLALLATVGWPSFLSTWQHLKLSAAADQVAAILQQARQVAIAQNRQACVRQTSHTLQILVGSATPCATGTTWTGPATDAAGRFELTGSAQVSAATAHVVFNHLGAAVTPGTYTIQTPPSGAARKVVVATTGRVSIR